MKLNKKLSLIASLIKPGEKVIDIGADHALLDIFLTLYNKNKCIATDIKKSALDGAFKNLKKYHLENDIVLIKSDGFNCLTLSGDEIIVISGMGTSTILEMIKKANRDKLNRLIISSNNDLELLRKTMMNLKYQIVSEIVVCEKNIFYVIISFEKGIVTYQKRQLLYGPKLLKENTLDRNSYYCYLIANNNQIIKQIPNMNFKKKFYLFKENFFLKKIVSSTKRK